MQLPTTVFKVTPINYNMQSGRGMMIVSSNDLAYINSRTLEQLVWPLKYLRKYGCNGDIFSFEAGRRCPGGEGLYVFKTKKASELVILVDKNIHQHTRHGGLQLVDNLYQPSNYQNNVQRAIALDQPNYQNITVLGQEVPQDGHQSYADLTLRPASPMPTSASYAELDLPIADGCSRC